MPDAIPDPIPPKLSEAFESAVAAYDSWTPGEPEPEVSFDMKPFPISAVFGFVTNFSDPMPERLQFILASLRGGEGNLGDRSYGSGARMRDRKERYESEKVMQRSGDR